MSNFLSGIAVILSLLASLMGAFAVFKVSSHDQQIRDLSQSVANQQKAGTNLTQGGIDGTILPQTTTAPVASNTSPDPSNATNIQPKQFLQPAFRNKAEVELLTVKRIQNPDIANRRDVVNVQFRVRRTGDPGGGAGMFAFHTTARNPETSEVYKEYRDADSNSRSTGSISLYKVSKGASVDAYVWIQVPEGVNTLDIYVPKTQVFRNVPITN
jgi:hypothetical protein